MSDGINPSELNEAPQRTDQIKEAAEVQPEVQEAAVSLEKATLKPEEKVEAEMEFKDAEDLETAFKETMEAPTAPEAARVAETPEIDGPPPDTGEDQGVAPVQESSPESAESAPAASAGEDVSEIPEIARESDEDGLTMVGPDGESGEPTFDDGQDGMQENTDLQGNIHGDGGQDDPMRDANRTDAEGQMGVVDAEGIDPIEGAGVPDLMDGRDGMGPGDLEGGPGIGLDQAGELDSLRDAAKPGADAHVGEGDSDPPPPPPPPPPPSEDSSTGSSNSSSNSSDFPAAPSTTPGAPVPTPMPTGGSNDNSQGDSNTDTNMSSGDESGSSSGVASGSSMGSSEGSSSSSRSGSRMKVKLQVFGTPDPEGGVDSVGETDRTLGGMIVDAVPDLTPFDDQDLQDSMTQPEDDESGNRPPPIEYDRGSETDPYSQYTGEETEGYGTLPGTLDADGSLVDPPSGVSGGETGNQPPPSDGGPGINPNLPGTGPAAGGPDAGGEGRVIGESVAEITGRPEDGSVELVTEEHVLPGIEKQEVEDKEGQQGEKWWTDMPQISDYMTAGEYLEGKYDYDQYEQDMAEWRSQFDSKFDAEVAHGIEMAEQIGEEPPPGYQWGSDPHPRIDREHRSIWSVDGVEMYWDDETGEWVRVVDEDDDDSDEGSGDPPSLIPDGGIL